MLVKWHGCTQESAIKSRHSIMRLLTLSALLVQLLLSALAPPTHAACCDVCLAQTDPARTEITYDPLVHDQCSPVKGICCYGCGFAHGAVSFQEGVNFDAATGVAVAKAGTRIRFAFSGVTRVTYDLLRTNQKKTSFVGNRSTSADREADGVFSICVTSGGSIAMRGWGSDSCTQATTETTVQVDAVDGAKCSAPVTPSASPTPEPTTKPSEPSEPSEPSQSVDSLMDPNASKSGKFDVASCNLNRGTVVTGGDGTKTCECAGDWSNPPACDKFAWTKTILTIAGALATVVRCLEPLSRS